MPAMFPQDLTINEQTLPVIAQLIEAIPGGFFLYRADGDEELLLANQRMADIFRCATVGDFREYVGNSFRGIPHPADLEACEEAISRAIRDGNGNFDHVRYRIVRRDGSIGQIDDYGQLLHTAIGDVYSVFAEDVTERGDAEELNTIVSTLSEDYEALFHIDFITGKLEFYRLSHWIDRASMNDFSDMSFSEKVNYFADKYVADSDRSYFLASAELTNASRVILSGKALTIRFRMISPGERRWFELKAVHHAAHVGKKCAIVGIRDVTDEVLQHEKLTDLADRDHRHLLAFHDIIHSGMWNITLDKDRNVMSVLWSAEYRQLLGYTDEASFPNVLSAWYDKLHPDDRDRALELFWKGARANAGEYPFDTDFRLMHASGRYAWYHAAGRVEPNGDGTYLYFGIFVDTTAEHENKEYQAVQQRDLSIIDILASEYSSVYFIDLTTEELAPYTMNEETETTFGSVFRGGITYSDAYRLYIDKQISPVDRARMLLAGSVENIRKELANKKSFITTYRDAGDHYCEMKFVKVGDGTPTAVALGFADRDELIRAEMAQEAEKKRNYEIIGILASEYSSVYYIDLTTDELTPYTMNEDTEFAFGQIFRSGIRYSEAFRLYVDQLILPADRDAMLHAGSIGRIMKELRRKKTFLTTYRSLDGHYCEMKFVRVGDDDDFPTAVALGFADKDAEIRTREEEQTMLRRNVEIIEILASEYSSVYYIDLTTDELDTYTMNEETESEFGTTFRSGIHFTEAFQLYVDTLVYEGDRAMMLKAGSLYNILSELNTKKSFITRYRSSAGHYCEMKFVKVGESEDPSAVALGFADKDAEIRAEMAQADVSARDAAVIGGLSDDFGCVIYASYDTPDEVLYRSDLQLEKNIPGWTTLHNFTDRLRLLTDTLVHPDDRESFRAATRASVVRDAVTRDKVYYVNFRLLMDGKVVYYQMKFVRDERHADTNVIVGFHNVDRETRREMDALESAQATSRAKTSVLLNMSRDIRVPIDDIMRCAKSAINGIDDRDAVRENLDRVQSAGEKLLALIREIDRNGDAPVGNKN